MKFGLSVVEKRKKVFFRNKNTANLGEVPSYNIEIVHLR